MFLFKEATEPFKRYTRVISRILRSNFLNSRYCEFRIKVGNREAELTRSDYSNGCKRHRFLKELSNIAWIGIRIDEPRKLMREHLIQYEWYFTLHIAESLFVVFRPSRRQFILFTASYYSIERAGGIAGSLFKQHLGRFRINNGLIRERLLETSY